MIVLQLRFTDDSVRLGLRPAHRDKLRALSDEGVLVAAGPFADESGAVIIFDADRERVQRAIDDDPYYTCEGVEILGVHDWTPVTGRLAT